MIPESNDIFSLMQAYERASDSPETRFRLVGQAGRVVADGESLERFLLSVLEFDLDPVVRHEAAFVIGDLKSNGADLSGRSVETLCRVLTSDTSLIVVHEAAESLGQFDGPTITHALGQLLRHDHLDIRATAEISLEAIARRQRPKPP